MTSISGGISFSGLGTGGLDFDAMIKQEKSIKEIPKKRLEAWQADWQLRYDAFDKLLTSVQTLSTALSKMSSSTDFLQKKVTSSNSAVATATGNSKAANGTNTIDVKQLATNAVLTNNHIFSSKNAVVTGAAQPPVFAYEYKGQKRVLQIPENCELDYLVTKINGDQSNPGVTAALLKTGDGYVFQLSGKDSGTGSDLKIAAETNLPDFAPASGAGSSTATSTVVAGPDAVIASGSEDAVFSYDHGGVRNTITLPKGSSFTARDLVDKINESAGSTGVSASLVKSGSGYSIQLASADGAAVTVSQATNLNATWSSSAYTKTVSGSIPDGANAALNPADAAESLFFSFDGLASPIEVAPGESLNDLIKKINEQRGTTGIKASMANLGYGPGAQGTLHLQLEKADGTAVTGMSLTKADGSAATGISTGADALADPAQWGNDVSAVQGWSKREAKDAIFTVNDLGTEFTSQSNTLTEVFDGLEVSLLSTGKTVLTTSTSTEDTRKKIEEFVDAYNELMKAFQEVDKYDEEKTTKTRAATKDEDGNYIIDYSSQFSFQKGGVLTGNYSVQMIESELKQMITGRGGGFRPKDSKTDPWGDPFTNLSSIGIIMDADEGSATFGMLHIMTEEERVEKGGTADTAKNPYKTLDMALAEDAEAVVDLFVGSGGTTDSPNFSYLGSIGALSTAPTPGEYTVEYTVDTAGTPPDFITVGGIRVPRDGDTGTYVVPSGPIAGVELSVDDLSAGAVSSTLRIKQGKIPQLSAKLKEELRKDPLTKDKEGNVVYDPNHKRGGLIILKENYQTIMKNIQNKIDQETTRLQSWEKRERLRYSRLDTLLGKYENLMSSNATALATASSE